MIEVREYLDSEFVSILTKIEDEVSTNLNYTNGLSSIANTDLTSFTNPIYEFSRLTEELNKHFRKQGFLNLYFLLRKNYR